MKSAMEMVAEFHRKHGMPHSDVPHVTEDAQRRILRLALLHEEIDELMDGLGLSEEVGGEGELVAWGPPDENAVADALADIAYLTVGAAVEWGIPLDRVFAEVHRSNMTKEPGYERADGKIGKGPEYSPPDVAGVLDGAMQRARNS